jgi:uncharacterized membrane protein YvbJ
MSSRISIISNTSKIYLMNFENDETKLFFFDEKAMHNKLYVKAHSKF